MVPNVVLQLFFMCWTHPHLSFHRSLCAIVWGCLNFGDKNGLLRAFAASERQTSNQLFKIVSEFVLLLKKILHVPLEHCRSVLMSPLCY